MGLAQKACWLELKGLGVGDGALFTLCHVCGRRCPPTSTRLHIVSGGWGSWNEHEHSIGTSSQTQAAPVSRVDAVLDM